MMNWRTKDIALIALASLLPVCAASAEDAVKAKQPVAPAPAVAPAPVADVAPQKTISEQDSLEEIQARLVENEKAKIAVEAKIVEYTKRVQDMLDNYNRAECNLTGFNGLGRVEQMELKAELYGGERLARKKLAEEFSVLNANVAQWQKLKAKQLEYKRLLALRNQIIELRKKEAAGPAKGGGPAVKMTDIEYYQVKKDADLRTISSYPEVYGTPELWNYLYQANKEKLQGADKPVPAGTTLVVPQDVKKLPEFSDL